MEEEQLQTSERTTGHKSTPIEIWESLSGVKWFVDNPPALMALISPYYQRAKAQAQVIPGPGGGQPVIVNVQPISAVPSQPPDASTCPSSRLHQ
eukprot:m.159300 g.159300  ORF g.159300 m.159300 type:complete len:94 (-) comp9838_c0_seq7:187-468(-)